MAGANAPQSLSGMKIRVVLSLIPKAVFSRSVVKDYRVGFAHV